MAGMEQLEVHSKSYLVRWVNVAAGHTISWSIQPHKKSINFGVFKHPTAANAITSLSTSSATLDAPSTPALEVPPPTTRSRGGSTSTSRNDKTFVLEKLSAIGLKQVRWVGKCEAEKVSMGTYDVPEGEGGMYGLVIDNTFSKTVSKTATFVLMTYPTNAAPKSGHHYIQASGGASTTSLSRSSPDAGPMAMESSESLSHTLNDRPKSSYLASSAAPSLSSAFQGVLQKKRRKRNQGYAKRFFSLDFQSSTLSYYRNDHSLALRGSIPLSLAAVGANEETREISVDSGAEVWQLRANSSKDFSMWKDALDRASRNAGATPSPALRIPASQLGSGSHTVNQAEESEWARVEALVGRVAGTRDAMRRLAQDTDPKYTSAATGLGLRGVQDSLSPSPSEAESVDYFPLTEEKGAEKKSFWKRKASSSGTQSPSNVFRRSVSAQVAVASPGTIPPVPPIPNGAALAVPKRNSRMSAIVQTQEEALHDHCMAMLKDLDSVVKGFSELLVESRQRRTPALPSPRKSIDSYESADEFFDAVDGDASKSQLLKIRRDSGENHERDDVSDGGSESSSEHEGGGFFDQRMSLDVKPSLFPTKPTSLKPLPHNPVQRRSTIAPSNGPPPSLISFLRKNVGKDLSTIAMPVTFNEPISTVQRIAEQLEYSELLDAAVTAPSDTGERLVYMAAFAISSFSNMRVKDRAMRKPYTPMLGETFELVREDKGYRFVAEKVLHRPLRMACHAESANWTFVQSPAPTQKFWGKSYEINTDGRVRVFLHDAGEHYSWNIATSFMRNVMAGEKYVEPTGTMTIVCETTGAKAICTFKAGGMFAGRSEDVTVQVVDHAGAPLAAGAQGKWTSSLHFTSNNQPIWTAGALVDKPSTRYGFTSFAASLNEITPIEKDRLPPTDSRLRPDQRAAEQGDMDAAEGLKARLEERQRGRRKVMEEHGQEWAPRWFAKVSADEMGAMAGEDGGEEVWRLKGGKEGYWECRDRGDWEGVVDVLEA